MAFRSAPISHTHLSRNKPYVVANFLKAAKHIASIGANLVLHTGDISLDGSAQEDDLIEAKRLHEVVDPPLRFIPGNHDIGESQEGRATRGCSCSPRSRASASCATSVPTPGHLMCRGLAHCCHQ